MMRQGHEPPRPWLRDRVRSGGGHPTLWQSRLQGRGCSNDPCCWGWPRSCKSACAYASLRADRKRCSMLRFCTEHTASRLFAAGSPTFRSLNSTFLVFRDPGAGKGIDEEFLGCFDGLWQHQHSKESCCPGRDRASCCKESRNRKQ